MVCGSVMDSSSAIVFEHVSKRFDGAAVPVLDDVCLTVPDKTFMVIVGASGSGKTTLLRFVNRLADPTSGLVSVGGAEVGTVDPISLRRRIGYVFQETGLFPHMTVEDNIAITPQLLGWDAAEKSARVDELMTLVRLDAPLKSRLPHQLSGGQRQRVGIARALAARPRIMLMDEPFAALDPLTRDSLGQDYRRLHEELDLTTLMITHDMLEALTLADRISVLSQGKIIVSGAAASLVDHQHPHVSELMRAPRRQAERVSALFGDRGHHGG
jgi:osmoprotectant transport system ATP-binding protein